MKTLLQKLRLSPSATIRSIAMPAELKAMLEEIDSTIKISGSAGSPDQVHLAVRSKADLEKHVPAFLKMLKTATQGWVYFPKGSSKLQQDLSRDDGWELLRNRTDLQQLSLISIDENWSAFSFRFAEQPVQKAEKPDYSPWINAKAKTTTLPPDVLAAFRGKKQLLQSFETLAYTHRREYLEWILGAKKEETRSKRIQGLLEKLAAKQK